MSAAKLQIVQVGTPVLRQRARALNEQEIRSRETRKLTAPDRAKINRQQNRLSRQIYNKKHDIHSK